MIAVAGRDHRIEIRGSTVVRPAGDWTPAVHALLDHLHHEEFDGSPRPVSHDSDREVLSLIPGVTPGEEFVAPWSGDEQLASVARLLRRYHDAAATFVPPSGAVWQATSIPTIGTLVCHTDLYRGNVVFRDGRAVGLIDFDFAHPADPIWDVAVAAWHWVPLTEGWVSDVPADRWPKRLRLFLGAYGLAPGRLEEVIEIVAAFLRNVRARALSEGRDPRQVERDIETLQQRRDQFIAGRRD